MRKETTRTPDFYVDSTITISTRHTTHSIRTPLLLLLAAVGCICMLIACLSMVQPVYRAAPFWGVTVLAIGLTGVLSLLPYQLHLLGWLPLLGTLGAAWHKREELILGGKYFYNAYYCAVHHTETQYFEMESSQPEEMAVTWLLCCCSAALCSLICRSLMRRPNFPIYFILTFIPLEFGLYEGLEMNLPAMITVVVTWFGVLAIHLAQRRSDTHRTRSVRAGNAASCGLAATALVTAAALIAVFIANQLRLTTDPEVLEQRREIRHGIENFQWEDIPSTLTQLGVLLGIAEDPEVRALGTKDSLTYKGADEMRITLTDIPEEGIYLKDYTGSVYDQNCWSVLPDKVWKEEERLKSLLEQYDCSPQILPFMANLSLYKAKDTASITIEPLIPMSTALMPYAAYASDDSGAYPDDTGWSTSDPEESYRFDFSLRQDFRSLSYSPLTEYYLMTSSFNFTDSNTANFFDLLGADTAKDNLLLTARFVPYQNSENYSTTSLQALMTENYVYRNFVYEHYTALPENDALAEVFASLPAELVSQAQYGDDWATLLAIRAYLSGQAEYTLSPGRTPSSRDFVNYFLLENGKGYCMHYATAGTLIARYLGIPARYCEGYIMSAEMMQAAQENEDGSVTLTLKDSAGHAWCEFYVEGYGWVPFEMTPGYYSFEEIGEQPLQTTTAAETEPFDFQAPSETTETVTKPVNPVDPLEQTTTASPSVGTGSNAPSGEDGTGTTQSGTGFSGMLRVLRYIALVVLGILLLLCIMILPRYITLRRREQAFRQADTITAMQQVYGYFMRLLREISLDAGNQQLLDFAEKIEPELDQNHLDGAAAKRLIALALQADPGGVPPSEDEVKECVRYTRKLAIRISQKSGTFRRWRMMFVRRLI